MSRPDEIAKALYVHCEALADALDLPLALPDSGFDPKTAAPAGCYLKVTLFPNGPAIEPVGSGSGGYQGRLQVEIVYRGGMGDGWAKEMAGEAIDHFRGAVLHEGESRVAITGLPTDSRPLIDGSETRLPVIITWAA